MTEVVPRIAITPGEPAGIGPDLVLALATRAWSADIVAIADPGLMRERAAALGLDVAVEPATRGQAPAPATAGCLRVWPVDLAAPAVAGRLDTANARYVTTTLDLACDACLAGELDALVTGPVHKGVINEAGIAFSGHTEYLAARSAATQPVMLLVADDLRVALVTTHLALRDVPDQITPGRLRRVIPVLHRGLVQRFGIAEPRILVLGLNPHAGESGHLGREELDVIQPVLQEFRDAGMRLAGPLPADTAFTPAQLARCDAVLAMYHDQGLPVLKHRGFGRAVNVTLGLPLIRTSVDHGTALELAGQGTADAGSLEAALDLAIRMSRQPHA